MFNQNALPPDQCPEVKHMLTFFEELEHTWTNKIVQKYTKLGLKTPKDLSSELTHQITQISVFYLLSKHNAGFDLPFKSVSLFAKLAKKIVASERVSVPRQTKS